MKCYIFSLSVMAQSNVSHCFSKLQCTEGVKHPFKAIVKIHRFTNNLQGLQKVMVKDIPWSISPWNALLFEKTVKEYQVSLTRITDLFQTHVMTRRNAWIQGWVFPLISPDSDDRLSPNFHRFVICYRGCDTRSVDKTVYRKGPMALKGRYTFGNYSKQILA